MNTLEKNNPFYKCKKNIFSNKKILLYIEDNEIAFIAVEMSKLE